MAQTRDEFIADYAARSGITPKMQAALGRVAEPCGCGASMCTGWRMVTSYAPQPRATLSHTDGCANTRHDPALTLCSNELIWPWTT